MNLCGQEVANTSKSVLKLEDEGMNSSGKLSMTLVHTLPYILEGAGSGSSTHSTLNEITQFTISLAAISLENMAGIFSHSCSLCSPNVYLHTTCHP